MAKVTQCDRCKKIVENNDAYRVTLDNEDSATRLCEQYDICLDCVKELQDFMKYEEDKTDEC